MISLRLFLLVLVTLACRELSEGESTILPQTAILAAMGMVLGFGLLFKASAIQALSKRQRCTGITAWERSCRDRECIETAWVVALPSVLLVTGWGQLLSQAQLSGVPQTLTLLGWFLPSLLLLVLLELTSAQLEELCVAERESDDDDGSRQHWASEWLVRMRLGEMASLLTCILPIAMISLSADLAATGAANEHAAKFTALSSVVALIGIVFFMPLWLGGWMGVVPFPEGSLRSRIHGQFQTLDLRGIRLMLLPSRGRWPGAALVGWFPRFRRLWLGDALIERLSPQQLDMVIMHELAHVARMHFLWRISPVLLVFSLVGMLWMVWPLHIFTESARLGVSCLVASLTLLVGLNKVAHACEFDADATACTLASRACDWAMGNPSLAAIELESALDSLLHDCPHTATASWLHPSLSKRRANLKKVGR